MAQDSYFALKQKIEKEILKLQNQAKALQTKRRGPVITSIIRSMREYDITPEEITEAFNKKATRATDGTPGVPGQKRTVPAKYRHPQTGESWTGRGKAPKWMTAAEAEGHKREDFLITD